MRKIVRKDKGTTRAVLGRLGKRAIFENASVKCKSHSTCGRILRCTAKHLKPNIRPPLKPRHENARLEWAKNTLN